MHQISLSPWQRIVAVLGVAILAAGAAFGGYRWYNQPTQLSIAVGSLDGELQKAVYELASRFSETGAAFRLKVVETGGPFESASLFSSGKTDLAIVRSDVGDLSSAQAIVVMGQATVLLLAPAGSPLADIADFKHVTIGVIGGEINSKLVTALTTAYALDRAHVTFKPLSIQDARRALDKKAVAAILVVIPLTAKYLALTRDLFSQKGKNAPTLIPIDDAGAIAQAEPAFQSFDVPKGTLRGNPAAPGDDTTTLITTYYLVAKKSLDNDMIASFTQTLMNTHRDLLGKTPLLAEIKAPDTDAGAYLPVHPGALEFYNGNQQSFLDKWSNAIFLTPMILGALASLLAATWRFLRGDRNQTDGDALNALYALGRRVRSAQTESELSAVEDEIDAILDAQRSRTAADETASLESTALNVTAHRLSSLVHDRRARLTLDSRPG